MLWLQSFPCMMYDVYGAAYTVHHTRMYLGCISYLRLQVSYIPVFGLLYPNEETKILRPTHYIYNK